MANNHPLWQANQFPGYDATMLASSNKALMRVLAEPAFRRDLLTDPRMFHQSLLAPFAPTTHPEYAGTFRGTANMSLADRIAVAPRVLDPGEIFRFAPPGDVARLIEELLGQVGREIAEHATATHHERLLILAHLFCWFGTIHPFLDGNGHVQRTLFAAAATEMGIPLSRRFVIHPRSYDRLLAYTLEMFTITNGSADFLAMAAEYLVIWLGGPYDAPAMGIAPL